MYTQMLILVKSLLLNFFSLLVSTFHHGRFKTSHSDRILPLGLPDLRYDHNLPGPVMQVLDPSFVDTICLEKKDMFVHEY